MKISKLKTMKKLLLIPLLIFCVIQVFAQEKTVTGKVTDGENGEPLPGVNVIVDGTQQGTVTDIDGQYSITVSSDQAVLVYSFVGYNQEKATIAGRTVINMQLIPELQALDEVVVIGYGTMKRSDLTGAVASIKQEDIAATKATNLIQVMQGKVAGLDLYQRSGESGASFNVTLRGDRSINANNSPLILVDGIDYGSTIDINPSDVESMEVLKDASSTAIYGTRGANGVILITTKKGKEGVSKVTFNSYMSYNVPTFIPHFQNADEFVQKRVERLVADAEYSAYAFRTIYNTNTGAVNWSQAANPEPWSVFGTVTAEQLMANQGVDRPGYLVSTDPTFRQLLDEGVNLNYLDMIFKNSITDNYELGITSGKEKTSLNFSLGLMNDRGLLENDKLKRYNVKLGVNHALFKNVQVGADILYTNKNHLRRNSGIFNQALKTGPVGILYNDDGTYREFPDLVFTYAQPNPLLDEVKGAYLNEIISNRIFGTSYLSWEIFKGLTFKTNLGVDLTETKEGMYQGPSSLSRVALKTAYTRIHHRSQWAYTWENTLNYTKALGLHEFQGLLGNSVLASENEYYVFTGIGQEVSTTEYYDWSSFLSSNLSASSTFSAQQMLSYFGRLNYKFAEKYLFQASLRADGSSVLAKGNKWGYFPSASVGWRINQEEFLKGNAVISNLKLRASWGVSGNAAIIPYQTITEVGNELIYYTFDDGSTYSSLFPFRLGNESLRWETTKTWDIGLDFGFFNNRINGSFDYYVANTTDLLFSSPLPVTSVYPQVYANIASTQNKGVELYINSRNVVSRNFQWSTDWNFSMNKNKIVSLNRDTEEEIYNTNNIRRIGDPVQAFYDLQYEGIYQVDDLKAEFAYVAQQQAAGDSIERGKIPMIANRFLPGDIKLKDLNNDGLFDDNDRIVYSRVPKFTFGISNNLNYKNWRLSFMIYGRVGQTIQYVFNRSYKPANMEVENGPYVDAWTPTNTGADFPRYYSTGTGNTNANTALSYLDGTYVKIRDITLGYTLPKNLTSKLFMSNLTIYATGKNLFTFSGIENYDPEVGGGLNFPLAKQYIVGLNLEF